MKDEQTETNIEAVQKTLQHVVEGKLDEALGTFETDSPKWNVAQGLPEAGLHEGADAIKKMLGAVRERYSGGYKLVHLTVHGTRDHVFAEYTRSPSTDENAEGAEHCLTVFEMAMGKIREARDFVHRRS
ncbi:MAG TPA: hypothetical protein RMH99_01280 [Sandaracinaceae bacterium LLY-WYZ-13_1]|nr:hypothetical protein [Sandaracinaceae bacterium LLY-WYZ-13_1]